MFEHKGVHEGMWQQDMLGHRLMIRDKFLICWTWGEVFIHSVLKEASCSSLGICKDAAGRLLHKLFQACPTERRPQGRPRTRWTDKSLGWPGKALVVLWINWGRWLRKGILVGDFT